MPRASLTPADLLAISHGCADAIARAGEDVTTAALVAASGLSERTFFRYFPTKADCLRPLLESGYLRFVDEVTERCANAKDGASVLTIVAAAFAASYDRDSVDGDLNAILVGIPAYRRVWLEINEDTATALIAPLAAALHLPEDHIDARIAADEATLVAVTAMRHMVRTSSTAQEAAEYIAAAMRRHPLQREITRTQQ